MSRILKFDTTSPSIGISVRSQKPGPEAALLNKFVEQYTSRLTNLKRHYALFFEPLLPTGYPDLVVVSYNPKIYESWTKERMNLSVIELKLLHHLYYVNGASSSEIERQLGLSSKQLLKALENLMDARLLRRAKHLWIPKALKKSYGVSNIKTIEAKISNWKSVFEQASMNLWFSSQSCVLSPVTQPSRQTVNKAKNYGVGIYSLPEGCKFKTIQSPARSNGTPISYASWMFNEWIGRQIFINNGAINEQYS